MICCHAGHKNWSSRMIVRGAETIMKTSMDPGGILKWGPRCRSMVMAWRVAKLLWMASGVLRNMPVDHSGKRVIRVLRSSTFCNVHSFHKFVIEPSGPMSPSVFRAARLRNL